MIEDHGLVNTETPLADITPLQRIFKLRAEEYWREKAKKSQSPTNYNSAYSGARP